MCGIPHHAAEGYIGKILRAGRKVALCDQLEEAQPGKLVNRDVTQILSPVHISILTFCTPSGTISSRQFA